MVLTERATGTGDQSLGVGEVGSPVDVDVHPQPRVGGGEMPRRPRMVEVYVGQTEMRDVTEGEPGGGRTGLQPSQAGRRARIDENELVADQERRADRSVETVEPDVDDAEALAQRSSTGTKVRSRRPVNTCLGRAILCSSSSSISCHWANHPTVRGIANSTGNISTGNPRAW